MIVSAINKIAILEPNAIIAYGLAYLLEKQSKYTVWVEENLQEQTANLPEWIERHAPDIILANPLITGSVLVEELQQHPYIQTIALVHHTQEIELLSGYRAAFCVTQEIDQLITLLDNAKKKDETKGKTSKKEEERQLSPREQDVVIWVAKGLTNKEIAAELDLSTHTVITHRKNISKKLQIHSPSGLTIYAITNNLISIDDIKQ